MLLGTSRYVILFINAHYYVYSASSNPCVRQSINFLRTGFIYRPVHMHTFRFAYDTSAFGSRVATTSPASKRKIDSEQ